MAERTRWYASSLTIKDEPLVKSLWEYRQENDRVLTKGDEANLISSLTDEGTHMPIIDLDFPHHFEQSTTSGHSHLYIDVEMSRLRLFVLLWALYFAGVIELGHFVWTLRRGASFVRIPGVQKTKEENTKPTYGWFRKLK